MKLCANNKSEYYETFKQFANDNFVYDCGNGCLIAILTGGHEPNLLEMHESERGVYLSKLNINQLCRRLVKSKGIELYTEQDLSLSINDKFRLIAQSIEALGKLYIGEALYTSVRAYIKERKSIEGKDKRRLEYKRFKERWAWLERYHQDAIKFVELTEGLNVLKL